MSSTQFVPACASELEPFSKLNQQSKNPIVGMRLWAFILRPSLISNFNLNFKFLILNFLCHLCVFTVSRVEKGGKIQLKSCAGRLLCVVLWQQMELCSEDEIDVFIIRVKNGFKKKNSWSKEEVAMTEFVTNSSSCLPPSGSVECLTMQKVSQQKLKTFFRAFPHFCVLACFSHVPTDRWTFKHALTTNEKYPNNEPTPVVVYEKAMILSQTMEDSEAKKSKKYFSAKIFSSRKQKSFHCLKYSMHEVLEWGREKSQLKCGSQLQKAHQKLWNVTESLESIEPQHRIPIPYKDTQDTFMLK